MKPESTTSAGPRRPLVWSAILLVVVLAILFHKSFLPGHVIFSNDDPFAGMLADQAQMPSALKGYWVNLNWFGSEGMGSPPSVSSLIRLAPPIIFAKIFCPATLFIVGMGACFCFRKLKLSPWACLLGGLAAALNSDFFSTACWGVASQTLGFGAMYVAIGFVSEPSAKRQWLRLALAGMAIGVGVMEAYDIGALFSLFVALYVVYHALFLNEATTTSAVPNRMGRGILRLTVVVVFAGLIATHTMVGLVGTQIKGISGTGQGEETKKMHWPAATQWSVPKAELLQVVVPGLFGYRNIWHMYENDQPTDDQYWGTIGAGGGLWRLVGTGFYGGIFVVLVALWTTLQSFRGRGSPFNLMQRRAIWFWSGAMVIALLLALGKNAPFYQIFYALPYASTIRNPQKFMHIFSWALVVVFAYGMHGLIAAYMHNPVTRVQGMLAQFKVWRATADPFARKWFNFCAGLIAFSLLGWLMYSASSSNLQSYLPTIGIDAAAAPGIAKYSLHAVGWFVAYLVLAIGLLALIFSGQFSGTQARWGALLIGLFLLLDLGRADAPWIVYWDTSYKYAPDPIINFLAEKPYEHRISLLPPPQNAITQQWALLQNAYFSAWKQHLFLSHNIQCLDVIQEPRVSEEKETFIDALPMSSNFNVFRMWELSNTRYLLGPGGDFVSQIDPGGKMFRVLKRFNFVPKRTNPSTWSEDYISVEDPNGQLAVIEFMNALPRAKLYANWQVSPDDEKTLQVLTSQTFDPHQSVLVSDAIAKPDPAKATQDPGTVEVNPNYRAKRVELDADVKVSAVLLLTERFSPTWSVTVDGKPAKLLRCNYLVRGVQLEPGKHVVVMNYTPSNTTLWISLSVIALGLLFWGILVWERMRSEKSAAHS